MHYILGLHFDGRDRVLPEEYMDQQFRHFLYFDGPDLTRSFAAYARFLRG